MHYQSKNQRKLIYPILLPSTVLFLIAAIKMLYDYKHKSIPGSLFAAIFMIIAALSGVFSVFYLKRNIFDSYKGCVEIKKDGVRYISPSKDITIKWSDISSIYLPENNFYFPSQRIIYFLTDSTNPIGRFNEVSESMIWSEFSQDMIIDIQKYWHGNIVNWDRYLKFSAKEKA